MLNKRSSCNVELSPVYFYNRHLKEDLLLGLFRRRNAVIPMTAVFYKTLINQKRFYLNIGVTGGAGYPKPTKMLSDKSLRVDPHFSRIVKVQITVGIPLIIKGQPLPSIASWVFLNKKHIGRASIYLPVRTRSSDCASIHQKVLIYAGCWSQDVAIIIFAAPGYSRIC